MKYFILQAGTEISSPLRKLILSPQSSIPFSCVQWKILQAAGTMCLLLLLQASYPELGPLLSTGGRSGFICMGANSKWGQEPYLCTTPLHPGKGKNTLERGKHIGKENTVVTGQPWQKQSEALVEGCSTLACAAMQFKSFKSHDSIHITSPLSHCLWATLPTISLVFQVPTCLYFEEIIIISS